VILVATLKKPWRSHRGKLYPAGTTFKFVRRFLETDSVLYEFNVPGDRYGVVVFPNKSFAKLTPEEKALREQRRKAYEDHMKNYKDRFIRGKI